MEIQLRGRVEKASDDILEIWEQIKGTVDLCRGVEDSEGRLLSHNAYLSASLGHNEYTTCIQLRAKNDDRLLATYGFSPSGGPGGFVCRYGKLVKLF